MVYTDLTDKALERIKVVVSEVDGVITDGFARYDELTNVPLKTFNMLDFEAINQIKKDFTFVFISCDNAVSYHLMRSKNIPFYHNPKDKLKALVKIMENYSVTPEEVLYVGSMYSDTPCMRLVPYSMCTTSAPMEIKKLVAHQLVPAGHGALSCLYDVFLAPEAARRRSELC